MNTNFFSMQQTFSLVCKNHLSHYLMLRNLESQKLRFFEDGIPIPIDLPFGPERLVNLKLGIPINFLGILKIEYKIDKPKVFQAINTIYYAETKFQSEKFENCPKEMFETEEPIWLDKEEIRKFGNEKCTTLIDFLENGGKCYPLSYMDEEH